MKDIRLVKEQTRELSILYVEDDLSLREVTSTLLQDLCKSLELASDGQDALQQYETYKKETNNFYDLVITDINMPKMNGVVLSEKILKINPDQAIIITTGHKEVEILSSALDLGINGFITKPIKHEVLLYTLYKVGKSINNYKFVEMHIGMIEDLNIRLENQNKELLAKNQELEKSFRILDTMIHKEQLVDSFNHEAPSIQKTEQDEQVQEQITDLINDDLFELKEIHTEIDLMVIDILSHSHFDENTLESLTSKFTKYSSILSFYNFFDNLGSAMKNFATTIQTNPIPKNMEYSLNTFMLLESFMYVLGKWQDNILTKDTENINALDASMMSDMTTIVNMWTQSDSEVVEEDLDDIFDF